MINEKQAKKYCRDNISRIENYEKAITDTTRTWHLHHRLELTQDGEFAHYQDELRRLGMFYDRPYFELIFLTPSEHRRLHMQSKALPPEYRHKMAKVMKVKVFSEEHKRNLSKALKGKQFSEEHKRNLTEGLRGRKLGPFSEEHRRRMSESVKAGWARRRAAM